MRTLKTLRKSSSPSVSRIRQAISLVLIAALVLFPLLGGSPLTPSAQAQICGGASPSRIFQGCPLLDPSYEMSLENDALTDLLEAHQLSPEDRSRLLAWQRDDVRSLIYGHLRSVVMKANPTDAEKTAIAALSNYVKSKRVEAAQFAVDEFKRWKADPCTYEPPDGFKYDGALLCAANHINIGSEIDPPTFQEFEAYGVMRSYAKLQDISAQEVMDNTVTGVSFFGGMVVGGIVGGLVQRFLVPARVMNAIFPYSARAVFNASANIGVKASVSAGTAAAKVARVIFKFLRFAGPVLVVVDAIVTSVLRGIEVADIAKIPGKLQEKLDEQRNAEPPDVAELFQTTAGEREVFAGFTLMTLPDFPATDAIPTAQDSDPKFTVTQDGGATNTTATINFISWGNDTQSARLKGGWFINKYKIDENVDQERWTLKIKYLNWRNEKWIAGRSGANFTHVKLDDQTQTFQSAEIKYLDENGNKATAVPILPNLQIGVLPVVVTRNYNPTSGGGGSFGIPSPKTFSVALVSSDSQALNTLGISVNNGSSATVNGVTISNLRVDLEGRVTADLKAECGATSPTTFNLRVTDSAQSKTTPLTVRLSPVEYAFDETGNVLSSTLPKGEVGSPYEGKLSQQSFLQFCSAATFPSYSVTSGHLPPGLSFGDIVKKTCTTVGGIEKCEFDLVNSGYGLTGTPASGGTYDFTVKITFGNGDSFSRDYNVKIHTKPASLPDGALSWWTGERGIDDDLKLNQGRLNNGFNSTSFARGKVGLAFSFNGSFGSVQLPDNFFDFAPAGNSPFTFETWFKTGSGGVIFGRQETEPWGFLPVHYSPGIYVGNDGKLRVQMFRNGTRGLFGVIAANPVTSATAVNDNAFHHVAVIYDGTQQIVYLDGAEMGRASYTDAEAGANVNYKYQLGTGFAVGWPSASSLSPWFGFNGLIDEPTMYKRALTLEEVKSIYAAGDEGKILIGTTNNNPTCPGSNNGVVHINVIGGAPPFEYSFDGGTTFDEFNVTSGLSSGPHSLVVKDFFDRTFSSSVTLNAPQPISLTPASVASPLGNIEQPVTLSFQANGGTGNKTLTLTGALPDGLTFTSDSANSAATIAGTPTQSGSFPLTINVKDANSCPTSQSFTLVVNGKPTMAGAAISRQQGEAASVSTIATVGDDLTAAGSLSVAVTNAPAGITVANVVNTDGTITADVAAACNATVGDNIIGLKVTDGGGLVTTTNATVNVIKSNAPKITLKPSPSLGRPNHKYATLTISQMVQSVTDECDPSLINSLVIEKVTSDEPDDSPGDADGITTNDIVIAADCRSLQLRSERDETKNGRVYAVTLRVTDSSGNITRVVFKVGVPLSGGGGTLAVEDATVSTVNSNCR